MTVRTEGTRQVSRPVQFYRLEMILAIGFRVRSPPGAEFRRWAGTALAEYLVKGFLLNDQRLKDPERADYFDELLRRIRDIRGSEKRFYQKLRDLFRTSSSDYDGTARTAKTFLRHDPEQAGVRDLKQLQAEAKHLAAGKRANKA